MKVPDGAESLTYHLDLLEFAAHMWIVSKSPMPPTLHEVLYYDRDWSMQVATMRETMRYFEDNPVVKGQENGNAR